MLGNSSTSKLKDVNAKKKPAGEAGFLLLEGLFFEIVFVVIAFV